MESISDTIRLGLVRICGDQVVLDMVLAAAGGAAGAVVALVLGVLGIITPGTAGLMEPAILVELMLMVDGGN